MKQSSSHLNSNTNEDATFKRRLFFAAVCTLSGMLILLSRAAFLQILEHEHYATQSDNNRIQNQAVPPIRGIIYDRKGRTLATNKPAFSLNIINERKYDAKIIIEMLKEHIDLSEKEIQTFYKQKRHNNYKPGALIPLKTDLTQEEISKISINKYRIEGIAIDSHLIRHYPYDELTTHVIGYVNRINTSDLETIDKKNYSGTNFIGRTGIEKEYEELLHGKTGFQQVEIDARNRVKRSLDQHIRDNGADLYLHLDIDLQKTAFELLDNYRGAIVAIDTTNGGVLAFASNPSYNPNDFVSGISQKKYNNYLFDRDKPLINRALRGLYPPASTIKPVVGLGLLEHQTVNWQTEIWDKGFFQLENNPRLYRDWKRDGHGAVDLNYAIAKSCDTYFYEHSVKLGIDKLSPFMEKFGLGKTTGIDLPGEKSGLLPSRAWKKAHRNLAWYPGDTINTSIGQGFTQATPLQMAYFTSILSNKGIAYKPSLLKAVNEQQLLKVPQSHVILTDKENWQTMEQAMVNVVHSDYGTARRLGYKHERSYQIAGKSGTAQVKGIPQDEKRQLKAYEIEERFRDHALFTAFAPVGNSKIAVAVIVENGVSGSGTAGPMAQKIFEQYLDNKNNLNPSSNNTVLFGDNL